MSSRLHLWLRAPDSAWLDPADTPLAMATLLVQIARSDDLTGMLRPERIDEVLALRYDLTASEAADLRRACDTCASAAPHIDALAALMRQHVPLEERITLAACLSDVMTPHVAQDGPHHILRRILGPDAV